MNRSLLAIILLATAAAAAEFVLLSRIAAHPAGGGDSTGSVFRLFISWAVMPLAVCVAAALVLDRLGRLIPVRRFALALAVGPFVALIALAQYGHGTPGLLLLAFVGQLGMLLAAVWKAWRNAA